jgi:epoxyqueuosine reductase
MNLRMRRRKLERRWSLPLFTRLRFLPDRSGAPAPPEPWPEFSAVVPDELRDVPGERCDAEEQQRAAAETPLHEFFTLHHEAAEFMVEHGTHYVRPIIPRLAGAIHHLRQVASEPSAPEPPAPADPAQLTAELRAEAERLGMSRIGITHNDPLYSFADSDAEQLSNVIVCVQEQDWEATQTAPSDRAELVAFQGYVEGLNRSSALAAFLKRRGYKTAPQGLAGDGIMIKYAVAAGLGQLGINGQLLTPEAGSRVRLVLITTEAPLVHDAPVDYGMHKICDECQACVRNCPVGAIPKNRKSFRGVEKAKLNSKRCLPVVVQVSGCAVCMKVCPVQRYGLEAILEHRERTGEILGVGTDELEGYDWPVDGRHYGPGETPKVGPEILQHKGLVYDPQRRDPAPGVRPTTWVGDLTPGA